MQIWFQRLIDLSSVASSEESLRQVLPGLVRDLGYDCYAYLNVQPTHTYAVSNYPGEWQARYRDRNYELIDPVVSVARVNMRAFNWTAENSRQVRSKAVRAFYREAGDFGIRSGISMPIRTPFGHMSMLTLASSKPSIALEGDIDQVAAANAVTLLHASLERCGDEPTAWSSIELTARQALCLRWSAEGKSMKAIAAIEGMSYATVSFHLNNARKALDAGSLAQATALATKMKLI